MYIYICIYIYTYTIFIHTSHASHPSQVVRASPGRPNDIAEVHVVGTTSTSITVNWPSHVLSAVGIFGKLRLNTRNMWLVYQEKIFGMFLGFTTDFPNFCVFLESSQSLGNVFEDWGIAKWSVLPSFVVRTCGEVHLAMESRFNTSMSGVGRCANGSHGAMVLGDWQNGETSYEVVWKEYTLICVLYGWVLACWNLGISIGKGQVIKCNTAKMATMSMSTSRLLIDWG